MTWLIEAVRDYHAWWKHTEGEEMDFITCGKWGYWKREPLWPRTERSSMANVWIVGIALTVAFTVSVIGLMWLFAEMAA
jgi:hypothetical protein